MKWTGPPSGRRRPGMESRTRTRHRRSPPRRVVDSLDPTGRSLASSRRDGGLPSSQGRPLSTPTGVVLSTRSPGLSMVGPSVQAGSPSHAAVRQWSGSSTGDHLSAAGGAGPGHPSVRAGWPRFRWLRWMRVPIGGFCRGAARDHRSMVPADGLVLTVHPAGEPRGGAAQASRCCISRRRA